MDCELIGGFCWRKSLEFRNGAIYLFTDLIPSPESFPSLLTYTNRLVITTQKGISGVPFAFSFLFFCCVGLRCSLILVCNGHSIYKSVKMFTVLIK